MAEDDIHQLIRELAAGSRKPSPSDGPRVSQHVSQSPFNRVVRPHETWARGDYSVKGCPHPSRPTEVIEDHTKLSSLEFHVAKRIQSGQWKASTTPTSYERDCQRAAAAAYLVKAGIRNAIPLVATQSRVSKELFPSILAPPAHILLVVYDASKEWISTGYCIQEADAPNRVYGKWVKQPPPQVLPLAQGKR